MKAELIYDFSTNVILPYTIFLIVAENIEGKNGDDLIKDMWQTFNMFFEDLNNENLAMNSDKIKKQIMYLSEYVRKIFWEFIDEKIATYLKEPYTNNQIIKHHLSEIKQLKERKVVDEKVVYIIRDLEVSAYGLEYNRKKDNDYE